MDMPEIFVDIYEPRYLYSNLSKWVDVKFKHLVLGDVVAGQICIERKAYHDFFCSLQTTRIFNQINDMIDNFDFPYLIIEGYLLPLVINSLPENRENILNSLFGFIGKFSRKLPVLRVERNFYSNLVFRIISQKESKRERPVVERRGRTKQEISEDILCALPKIGRSRARKILSHFKSIEHFLSSKENVISGVKGLEEYRKYFR